MVAAASATLSGVQDEKRSEKRTARSLVRPDFSDRKLCEVITVLRGLGLQAGEVGWASRSATVWPGSGGFS